MKHKPSKAARTEFDLGVQAWLKGRSEEAADHFTETIRLDPDSIEARMNLGIIYVKTGRPEQALDQDERALVLEPNLAILHTNKAAALGMLNRWGRRGRPRGERGANRFEIDGRSVYGGSGDVNARQSHTGGCRASRIGIQSIFQGEGASDRSAGGTKKKRAPLTSGAADNVSIARDVLTEQALSEVHVGIVERIHVSMGRRNSYQCPPE
ncbi:MAG: tetratricopeptide repeat protein [Bryobacterales bacterium]|nr:tetratricopeptide repeat protein [Bryobacterales bacterium]